ncbi:MAG: hypothetical protein IJM07_02885 [Pyramidobacter sp.]|nr:hypothetical protein [Pyramidobacter sp.]
MSKVFSPGMEDADLTLLETFGEDHQVQGQTVFCVLDEDEYRYHARTDDDEPLHGVTTRGRVMFVKRETLGFRPESGDLLTVDGTDYLVSECLEGEKLLTVTLEENHS